MAVRRQESPRLPPPRLQPLPPPVSSRVDSKGVSMADRFSVTMARSLTDTSTVWSDLQTLVEAIKSVHPDPGRRYGHHWSLRTSGRTWERSSLAALHEIAESLSLTEFWVDWEAAFDDLHWVATGIVYEELPSVLEAKGYAGRDRMLTEQLVRDAATRAANQGLEFSIRDAVLSSTDDGDYDDGDFGESALRASASAPATSTAAPLTPVAAPPTVAAKQGVLKRVRLSIATHLTELAWAVAAGLIVGAVLYLWGFAS